MNKLDASLSYPEMEEKKREEQKKQQKERENLIVAINNVFSGKDGETVLKYFHDICGYSKPNCIANMNTGDPQPEFSFYNEGRRSVYLDLRSALYPETLRSAFQGEE